MRLLYCSKGLLVLMTVEYILLFTAAKYLELNITKNTRVWDGMPVIAVYTIRYVNGPWYVICYHSLSNDAVTIALNTYTGGRGVRSVICELFT